MIDPQIFRRWWEVFHTENPLVEIRMLGKNSYKKVTVSGYFTDCEEALQAIQQYGGNFGIYAPINVLKSSCYGKSQHDKFIESPDSTTSDNDIEVRHWILIDLDPKRSAGTNSSNEEKLKAWEVMSRIGTFLRDQGFNAPVVADSANGYHLYYRVNLVNSPENTQLIKSFLEALDMQFSNEWCDVDTSVFNAARIAKCIGTSSVKGADTKDRPQRMSQFIKVPDVIKPSDIAFIRKVANMIPKEEKPSRFNGYLSEKYDLDGFIQRNGIQVARRNRFGGGERIILEHCPFCSDHKAPDSALFRMDSGAIGFKCLHNSCSQYTWRDVRMLYEPGAYDKRDYEAFQERQSYNSTAPKPAPEVLKETEEKGHKWYRISDVKWVDPMKQSFIPTGLINLDKKVGGLSLGDVSIVSGLAGSGKSTIINNITLNAIQRGYKVAVWSGELQAARFVSWIDQVAAGRNFVRQKAGYQDWYYCPQDVAEKINTWLDGKLWLYNNEYGSKWSQLFADIKECVKENGTQLVVIDNLAAMSLDAYDGDKNERQTRFMSELKEFAKQSNIAVIQVIHPRKETMNSLLRMESISGSFDLVNLSDNVFLCHRVGRDFEKRATDFFGSTMVDEYSQYDEVIEVAKNRSFGIKDFLVGLYFEIESRRFKNDVSDYVVYGWQEQISQQPLPLDIHEEAMQPDAEAWELEDLPL